MKTFRVTVTWKDEPTQKGRTYFLNADSRKGALQIVRETNDEEIKIKCIEGTIKDGVFYPL